MSKKKKNKEKYIFPEASTIMIDGQEVTVYGNEKLSQANVADAATDYSCFFGANKNLYRIEPNIEDGCRPGKRRFLWAWWIEEGRPQNINPETLRRRKFYKVAILSSKCMEYHPHSDSGVESMIGIQGQSFSNNVLLLDPQGSYGNLHDAGPAAGRYIEARMSEFTIDCFFSDFDKYCVPMKKAYDGIKEEPLYLPAKYPFILFNPQFSGIGYGIASNIPSFNVKEALEATIKLIKNPKEKVLLIPDIPTGADIIDNGQFEAINKTGRGQIIMQATSEIDYNLNTIKFTSIPLGGKTKETILAILKMKKEKGLFDEISNIYDNTKRGDVDLVIKLKQNANPEKVLEKLYKKQTGLRMTFPVGINVIEDYENYELGVRDLILKWIEYRRDAVLSMMLNSLQIAMEKQHMNKVLLMVFSKENIEDTIKITRNSVSKKEAIEKLMKRFSITSLQAGTIADMRVYNFTKDSYERYKEESTKLKEEVERIKQIVESDDKIDEFIINQLKEGIERYGEPRRSKVIKVSDSEEVTEEIPDIDYIIGVSGSGYIKKLNVAHNSSIGSVGKKTSTIMVLKLNNREDILIIDSTGNVCKVPISAVPEMKFEDIGVELSKFFPVKGGVKAMMELPNMKVLDTKDDDTYSIILITSKGIAKKVLLSEFKRIKGSKSAITLDEGDSISTALFNMYETDKDIIISTNKGNGIRLPISEVRTYKSTARGLQMISLSDDEYVTSVSRISQNDDTKLFLYVTDTGKMKLTEPKYFPVMKRNDTPLTLMSLSEKDTLIGISSVMKDDEILVYKKNSEPERLSVKDVPIKARMSKGEKMVKLDRGDSVVSYKIFRK